MGLVVRKLQSGAQDRIRSLVAQHAQSLEPGLSVLETSLRLGRATIDVVALDAKQTLVLVVAGEVADEKMLISTLDAYVWCLAFPESVQRLYPAASIVITRPPRVIFVAERIPDTFLELVERLSVVPVECQELSNPSPAPAPAPAERPMVAASPAPQVLPVAPVAPVMPPAPVAPVVPMAPVPVAPVIAAPVAPMSPAPTPPPARRGEPAPVAAGFDATVAHQWESFLSNGSAGAVPVEPIPTAPPMAEVPVIRIAPPAAAAGQWPPTNHAAANGHASGHTNGHTNGYAKPETNVPMAAPAAAQAMPSAPLTQAMRAAEASIEHAAVDLGSPRVTESPAAQPQPEPVAHPRAMAPPAAAAAPQPPAAAPVQPLRSPFKSAAPVQAAKPAAPSAPESPTVNHPALESLKFPKGGVSRQWQDFLDQLAAANK